MQVTQAIRDQRVAQVRLEQLRDSVQAAQDDLDAARQLALAAKQLRQDAARTCVSMIRRASHAGIRDKPWWSWEKIQQAAGRVWHVAIGLATSTVAVLGVAAMVVGGPVAWMVSAAALVLLTDALARYANGQASRWDVGFALLGCIPGSRGLSTAGLGRGAGQVQRGGGVAAGVLRAGAAHTHRVLNACEAHLAAMAANLRAARQGFAMTVTPDGRMLMVGGDALRDTSKAAGRGLTASEQRAIRSLQRQIEEHRAKLEAYRVDPDAFDNQGILERAPTPAIRQRIIDGRIRHLEQEISAFQKQISKILRGGGQ
ncbi:hypothetical protein BL254_23650 [Protofrankia sp. BMG5.30]|uniref:Uncharacterized protein n=1 Tax=Protofrankia coriariae TaxID=1562887 RepID=A0ABR5EYQ1_9ACTN|nr:hypothetical protein FrCorBMG51_23840 [Protofrankia coriariae]ONH31013.1 hypothetical protein BL254_23650 [Protofrankia sp. BMG5.30]